jgi:hypothetical protein
VEQRLQLTEDKEAIRELLIAEPAPFRAGHYEDSLVREDGVWKFKRRQVFAEAKQP